MSSLCTSLVILFEPIKMLDVLNSMKTLLIILLSLFVLVVNAQKLFTVTGTVQMVSYHQGGIQILPSEMMPTPSKNVKLYVVEYLGPKEKSVVVGQIKSDENGKYEIKLPPGKYGFVLEKDEIRKGTFLPGMNNPKSKEIDFQEIGYQDYWELNTLQPFEVTNIDLSNINITHYMISVCYTCP